MSAPVQAPAFTVRLDNFEGPFDLLLQLIAKHRMDVTEVALSRVTNEFIAHIKAAGSVWDLEQTSQFVLVAATLLDLKAARLLPSGEVEDAEDLALLEARDLLFARLLQYRAFKQVAAWLSDTLTDQGRRFARPGGLEERYARVLPEVTFHVSLTRFAQLAARAMQPRPVQELSLAHLHAPEVSVRDQATLIVARLRRSRSLSFRALTGDADRVTTVARFLALLELYRERAVTFEQVDPLGELTIRWVGSDEGELEISAEFDVSDPDPGDAADADVLSLSKDVDPGHAADPSALSPSKDPERHQEGRR